MGLVSTWLNGIGLSRQVATFQAAGIVTPAALAELEVQHFEALGISDSDDRRKLFYLVQRIKMAVNKDKQHDNSVEDQVDAVISGSISKSLDETPETLEDEKKTETIAEETGARRRSKRLASSKKQESAPNNAKENLWRIFGENVG